jgi:hypothetical protein
MKHEVHRLRPVFDGSRYCGALIRTARGWDAHDATGKVIGTFPEADAAVKRLRKLATEGSTQYAP